MDYSVKNELVIVIYLIFEPYFCTIQITANIVFLNYNNTIYVYCICIVLGSL